MVHHIAELISRLEASSGQEGDELRERCRTAILDLWAHRASIPGRQPLQELEPVFATLQALRPEEQAPYYRQEVLRLVDCKTEDEAARGWLRFALELDSTARLLISDAIDQAAAQAIDKAAEWVKAATPAVDKPDALLRLAALLQSRREEIGEAGDWYRKRLEERLERLDGFSRDADQYRSLLASAIEAEKDKVRNDE